MRRSVRYGALGVVLLAAAAVGLAWRAERPPGTHPELSPPAAVIAASPTVPPAPDNAVASAAIALPIAVSGPTTAAPTTASSGTAAPSAAASFDVVRISPEGRAVIAGRAQPNAEVVALDGDTVIGRATADKQGEWVILPASTLPPGSHTLRLGAPTPSDRSTTAASDLISITVPASVPSGPPAATPSAVAAPSTAPIAAQSVLAVVPAPTGTMLTEDHAVSKPTAGNVVAGHVVQGKRTLEGVVRDKSLIVRPGNSLWRIARQSYGAGDRYAVIYSANRDRIGDPDLIYPGQVFTLPSMN